MKLREIPRPIRTTGDLIDWLESLWDLTSKEAIASVMANLPDAITTAKRLRDSRDVH